MPARVRVPRNEHLPFVGRCSGDRLFLAYVAEEAGAAWAVLHLFDGDGRRLETQAVRSSGPAARRGAEGRQQQWLRQLSTMLLTSIEVEPFTTLVDGVSFGLVAEGGGFRLVPGGPPVG